MKFLHMADVHLGCTRYQLAESPSDFFDAWIDVLRRYAIGEKVDFVLICGDFFHKRVVQPETMDHAVAGLTEVRDAGIPVIAIEGNHDQKYTDSEFSWLRSLAKWGLITLLEPERRPLPTPDPKHPSGFVAFYEPWDAVTRKGGYIDVGDARIFGSQWYGASGNWAIPMLSDAIKDSRRPGGFHILMLHTDIEGHQVHAAEALSMDSLSQMRPMIDYVALGHTHRQYAIDNWAFNPGSIEVTNIAEYTENRGVFLVDVDAAKNVTATHLDEYTYRPFQRLVFSVTEHSEPADLANALLLMVREQALTAEPDKPRPIVEITLRGQLGFPNSLLETQKLRDEITQITGALHIRLRNHTVPAGFVDTVNELDDAGRERLERTVISDLVVRDTRYRERSEQMSEAVVGAKRMVLGDEPADKIAEFISQKAVAAPK